MYSNSRLKRSWVEVNLGQIVENYRIYNNSVNAKEIMAVIKADAYGYGDTEVAKILQSEGVQLFAVSNIEETVSLREVGITGEILIPGYTSAECAEQLVKYDITQVLLDENYAEMLACKGIKAQFAIDTGMNRIALMQICQNIAKK